MWPNIESELLQGKLDAVRDLIRVAYSTDGTIRQRLFGMAREMLAELADMLTEKEEDDE